MTTAQPCELSLRGDVYSMRFFFIGGEGRTPMSFFIQKHATGKFLLPHRIQIIEFFIMYYSFLVEKTIFYESHFSQHLNLNQCQLLVD